MTDINQFFNESVALITNDAGLSGVNETELWSTIESDFRTKLESGYFPGVDPVAQIVQAQKSRWVDYSRTKFNRNIESLGLILREGSESLWGAASPLLELPVRVNGLVIATGFLTVDSLHYLLENRRDNLKKQQEAFSISEDSTLYLVGAMSSSGAEYLEGAFKSAAVTAA